MARINWSKLVRGGDKCIELYIVDLRLILQLKNPRDVMNRDISDPRKDRDATYFMGIVLGFHSGGNQVFFPAIRFPAEFP